MLSSGKKRGRRAMAALLGLLLLALAGCGGAPASDVPELVEPKGVAMDTAVVKRDTIYNIAAYEGLVLPQVHELGFSAGGMMKNVTVCVGSHVKAGDVLAELDCAYVERSLQAQRDYLAYLEQNEAYTERKQEVQIELQQLRLDRQRAAGASRSSLRLLELQLEELRAGLSETRELYALDHENCLAAIADMEAQLSAAVLKAPCDGTVVTCSATDGGYALENMGVIWLAEDSSLYISSSYVSAAVLSAADRVYATVAGQPVEVVHAPQERAAALSGSDARSSAFAITDGKGAAVESGMSAVVFVVSDTVEDTLVVPAAAVRTDGNRYFVYKLVDGAQVKTIVKRGVYNHALVEIVDGVEEGDVLYAGN